MMNKLWFILYKIHFDIIFSTTLGIMIFYQGDRSYDYYHIKDFVFVQMKWVQKNILPCSVAAISSFYHVCFAHNSNPQ